MEAARDSWFLLEETVRRETPVVESPPLRPRHPVTAAWIPSPSLDPDPRWASPLFPRVGWVPLPDDTSKAPLEAALAMKSSGETSTARRLTPRDTPSTTTARGASTTQNRRRPSGPSDRAVRASEHARLPETQGRSPVFLLVVLGCSVTNRASCSTINGHLYFPSHVQDRLRIQIRRVINRKSRVVPMRHRRRDWGEGRRAERQARRCSLR